MASTISSLVSVRLNKEVIARIDAVSARTTPPPGIKPTRSNTVRMLILRGLEATENRAHVPKPAIQEEEDEKPSPFESWAY